MNKLCWLTWCLVALVLFLCWRDDSRVYNGKPAGGTVGKGFSGGSWSTKWYVTPAKEIRSEVGTYDGKFGTVELKQIRDAARKIVEECDGRLKES